MCAQFDLRIKAEQRRSPISRRGCIAQIAGDGAAVLDLDRADLARSRLQRIKARRKISPDNVAPGGRSADAPVIVLSRNTAKPAMALTSRIASGIGLSTWAGKTSVPPASTVSLRGQCGKSFIERIGAKIHGAALRSG